MAIKVYQSKIGIPNIGINVSGANTAPNSLQSISNSFAQTSNVFFQGAADAAEKKGKELGLSVPIENIIGINPENGKPEAYSIPEGFGTIAMDAFTAVIDQRFFESIEADYKAKAKELYGKNKLDVKGFESSFLNYTAKVVDKAQGKFKQLAREIGINQLKGYSAHIQNNLYQHSITKAKELNDKQDDEYILQMYEAGKGRWEGPDAYSISGKFDKKIPEDWAKNNMLGFIQSKQALIASGITTSEIVRNQARDGYFTYLSGKFSDVLDDPNLARSEVNSDGFVRSLQRLEHNPELPKVAQEFLNEFIAIQPSQDYIDTLTTMYKSDKSLRSEVRTQFAKDATERKKKAEKEKKRKDAVREAETELGMIEAIESLDQEFFDKVSSGLEIDIKETMADLDSISEKARERVILFKATDGSEGIKSSAAIEGEVDKVKGKLVNQFFTSAITAMSQNIKDDTTEEDIIKMKETVLGILAGDPNVKLDSSIIGDTATKILKEIQDNISSPESFIKDFNQQREFFSLDNKKKNIQEEAIALKERQKEEIKRQNDSNWNRDKFNALERWDTRQINILNEIKNNGSHADVFPLINEIKSSVTPLEKYNDKSLLTPDQASKRLKSLRKEVATQLLTKELIGYVGEDKLDISLNDLENLDLFLKSNDSRIKVNPSLMKQYENIQKQYNIDAKEMRTLLGGIVTKFKERMKDNEKLKQIVVDYTCLIVGTCKATDPREVEKIQNAYFGLDGGNSLDYNSASILNNISFFSMIANGNVPQSFLDDTKLLATDPGNPKFQQDMSFFVTVLQKLRTYPTGVGNETIDITPFSMTNNKDIQRLMVVLNMIEEDPGLEMSNLVSLLTKARDNVSVFEAFKEENKTKFKGDSFEKHVNDKLEVKNINRVNNPDFFRMLDNELPVAVALGSITNMDSFDNYLEKRYKDRWKVSTQVLENPSNSSGTNMTDQSLITQFPDKELRIAVENSLVLDKAMPFLIEQFSIRNPDLIENGFGLKFGNKIYGSKDKYDERSVFTLTLSPLNNNLDVTPMNNKRTLDDGYVYYDQSLSDERAEEFGFYIKMDGMSIPLPIGNIVSKNKLDPLTEHHYTTIRDNKALVNGVTKTTVSAMAFGVSPSFLNGVKMYYLLPTFWDGRNMPVDTELDRMKLIERINKSGKTFLDYPSFLNPNEAKFWYDEQKTNWLPVDSSQAHAILGDNSYEEVDIFKVNPYEIARELTRHKAVEANEKYLSEQYNKNTNDIMNYNTRGLSSGDRFTMTREEWEAAKGTEGLTREEAQTMADQMAQESVDERNARKRKAIKQMRDNHLILKENLSEHFLQLFSIHPQEGLGLPGVNLLSDPDFGQLSPETDDAIRQLFEVK